MRKIDAVFEDEPVGRNDADALLAVANLDRMGDAEWRDADPEVADARGIDEVHERERAAVDDRHFRPVDLDVDVRHSAGHDGGEEMFHGAYGDIVFADRSGVVESGGRGLKCRDAET